MKRKYIVIGAILLVVGGGYYWYKQSSSQTAVRYVTEAAKTGTLTAAVTASGNISVDQEATVDPGISGTVENLTVKVGDPVKKGQLLFSVDNDQLGVNVAKSLSSLRSAERNVQVAETDLKQAKADLDDAEDDGNISLRSTNLFERKIDDARKSVESARESLASARADYRYQLSIAAKRQVRAPIDGTVNEVNVKNGDDLGRITSGNNSQAAVIVGDLGTLKASVDVNEVDIPQVKVGQKVTMTFNALGDFTATGVVEKIASLGTVSQGVVTYDVTIGFDTLDGRIRPDMSVSASIVTDVKENVLLVPNGAVKSDGEGYSVQVLRNGSPERRTVEIGANDATNTEITSGLKDGDKVVTQTIDASASSSSSSSNRSGSSSGLRIPGLGGGGR